MKIVFTGGVSGGHFYPNMAVAEALRDLVAEKNLVEPELFYLAPDPFDEETLFEIGFTFRKTPAGKMRRYASVLNVFDFFIMGLGVLKAIWIMYRIFPDVVFSKGGGASIPTLFAARLLGIPVIIHESDARPGRANKWAAEFARRIGISYEETAEFFPEEKTALVGNPIRKEVQTPQKSGAYEFLKLEEGVPVILVLGGSQGAQRINNMILDALPELVKDYQIVHQTGKDHYKDVSGTASIILQNSKYKERYRPFSYLNTLAIRMSAGVASLVVSRAGSGAIFEIASWGKPSVLIPIPEEVSHDQRYNAFAYARNGACLVLEEENISPNLFLSEIRRLMEDKEELEAMKKAALAFARPEARKKLAQGILDLALEHER